MRVAFKSNNTTAYVLEDLELTDKVLGKLRGEMIDLDLTEPEERLPEDFLNMLVGYDYLKELILRSLKAERPLHILLIGPPASGKSIVLSEIGRLPRSRGDGSHLKALARLSRVQLLIIDDFLLTTLVDWEQRDLLEVIEDRYQLGATIMASQCPISDWHPNIGDPTLADAICGPAVA